MAFGFRLFLGLQKRVCIAVHLEKDPKLSNLSSEVSYAQVTPLKSPECDWGTLCIQSIGETRELSPLTSVSLQALQKTSDQPSALQQRGADEESLCLPSQGLQILVPKSKQSFFITKHHGLCEPRRLACLLLLL